MNTDTSWGKAHYSAKLFSDRNYRNQRIWIVEEVIKRNTCYFSGDADLLTDLAIERQGATIEVFVKSHMDLIRFTAEEAWAIALSLES